MGRGGISGLPPGDHCRGKAQARRPRKKAAPGVRVIERDGYYHLSGTLRAGGRRQSVRKSTGLRAIPENKDAAEALRVETERQFRELAVHGKYPSVPVAIAAEQFLSRSRGDKGPLNDIDARKIREITSAFGYRIIGEISDDEWIAFIDKRMAGRAAATRERYLNLVMSFLAWCKAKPRRWLAELPEFERHQDVRKPRHRRARRVADLTVDLILLMIENAGPQLQGQIAAMWATGGRVSSILYFCRLCDYVAAEGREQLTYQTTKNGDPVTAALHPLAAAVMRRYLKWRGNLHDREGPLFLTERRKPYKYNDGEWGNQLKSAWRGMRRRAIADLRRRGAALARELRRRGDRDEAREAIAATRDQCSLVAQVTPHWFRHHLATFMLSNGADLRSAMDQGGWRDPNSVIGYSHDVPAVRRAFVEKMAGQPVSTSFARGLDAAPKVDKRSTL